MKAEVGRNLAGATEWRAALSQPILLMSTKWLGAIRPGFSIGVMKGGIEVMRTTDVYNCTPIRPLVVSPLNHPESVPSPWGFPISGARLTEGLAT